MAAVRAVRRAFGVPFLALVFVAALELDLAARLRPALRSVSSEVGFAICPRGPCHAAKALALARHYGDTGA